MHRAYAQEIFKPDLKAAHVEVLLESNTPLVCQSSVIKEGKESPTPLGFPRKRKKNSTCLKEKGPINMVVREDNSIAEVLKFSRRTLVGRFIGKSSGEKALETWLASQ